MSVFDDRVCELGEGPFWHPERSQFFWFDILNRRLLTRDANGPSEWQFEGMASAAGWVDRERMILATEIGLSLFNIAEGTLEPLIEVEGDDPGTRSNDGRADRQGGFWFGTMGKKAERRRGAIYRYYRGELRRQVTEISIPNAICFTPDGRTAYFADTPSQKVWRQPLDADGWPEGERRPFLDLSAEGLYPDGAVVDAEGGLWCALWSSGRVARFDAEGRMTHHLDLPGKNSTCPAFGGADMRDLLVTSALEGMTDPDAAQGLTYLLRAPFVGIPEPCVIL
ncbi:SMP-30/gluconolactonase/LRE family protein [Thioclava sp. IC9]|uniref:SMP-30/gluconolactonase/LRE family protein n=1 Tax=Thioclava sp. IC9 TaxID=1973007 RepID=UPI000B54621F|nr:SMP-30/gluconolactonase/LRE family protein [Thioclava sp. IC9]OWX99282.1 gluconolactonase [Thioclava sp. IC9]